MERKEVFDVAPRDWDDDRKVRWMEENATILWSAVQSYCNLYEREDLMQMAREVTLQAFLYYDPKRGVQLGTYVYQSIRNRANMMVRSDHALKRAALTVPYYSSSLPDGRDLSGYDNLDLRDRDILRPVQPDVEEVVEQAELVRDLLKLVHTCLPPQEKTAFLLKLDGDTQEEIGKEMGLSQARISRILQNARLRVLSEAKKEGLIA